MYKLTKIDKILIEELLDNSRIGIKDIAKKFNVSRLAIYKRMKILEKEGILGGYTIDFNAQKIGLIPVNILFKIQKIPELKSIKDLTKKLPFISRCLFCIGPFNMQIKCYVKRLEDIKVIVGTISQSLKVQDFEYVIPIERTFFIKDFFNLGLKVNKIYGPFYEGLTSSKEYKKIDLEILTILTENSRQSISQIAEIIKKPISTVNFSFKRLKKEKIIEKFSTFIRAAKFGYDVDFIKIRLKKVDDKTNRKLFEFCRNNKVFVYHRLFGKWDYNIQLFVSTIYETYEIVKELQKKIQEIEAVDVFRAYRGYPQPVAFEKLVK